MPPSPCVALDDTGRHTTWSFSDPIAVIEAHDSSEVPDALARIETARRDGLFVAGYMCYELAYALEPKLLPLLPPNRTLPLLWFGVFDHAGQHPLDAVASNELLQLPRAYAGPLEHEWNAHEHGARFEKIQNYIAAGDVYQVNLSFRSRFKSVGEPFALYLALRQNAGDAHCAFIDDGTRQILSASPELFFDLSRAGTLTTRPMKGTAPRGTDAQADLVQIETLATSEKNRAENLMIVDLLRNDVGRIAKFGSVAVDQLFTVETYPTLHQMVSTITGLIAPDVVSGDVIRALFPCGSVTGAPKLRALEIIRELETSPRGVYCGAIGAFMPDGSARFNVAIRTVTITDGAGELGVGSGIVHESCAADEYAECLLKARHYESARPPIELIETLLYSPERGLVRGEAHLNRMQSSAETFGMPFDREAAAQSLVDAAIGRRGDAANEGGSRTRIRIILNEAGEINTTTTPFAGSANEIWRYAISPARVSSNDALLRHKTTWRELYDNELVRMSKQCGCDEVLFTNERGELTEGTRTNLFVQIDGQLFTPPRSAGLLDGRLRNEMLSEGQCNERTLYESDLHRAEQVFLGNSLRELMSATAAAS